jgi:anti-anti-sigma regulatory factor
MVASQSRILTSADRLTHEEACRLSRLAMQSGARTIMFDLSRCLDASTAGFARLVLLRRELLQNGRDFWLAGLRDRAARLFEVHRLEGILPCVNSLPESITATSGAWRISAELTGELSVAGAF